MTGPRSTPRTGILRRSSRILPAVLLLLSGSPTVHADDAAGEPGKGHGVEVWPLTHTELLVEPGQVISTNVRITNKLERQVRLEEAWDLPEGWDTVIPPGRIELEAGEDRLQLLAVNVPHDAAAGTYAVTYRVASLEDPSIQDETTFQVTVKRMAGLSLQIVSPPTMVVAGEPVQVQVALHNDGNAPAHVKLTAKTRPGYRCTLTPDELDIAARARVVIDVRVDTDPNTRKPEQQSIPIVARETDTANGASARVAIVVETVPRADVRPILFETIPTTVTARAYVDNDMPGYQLEWRGHGTLGKHHDREVDFMFKGPPPENMENTLLGIRDEYRVTYRGPNLEVQVGDQTYRLSRLVEQSQYGLGLGVHLHPGPLTAGAFYVQPRWGLQEPNEFGVWGGAKLGKWMTLKLNALSQGDTLADTVGSFHQAIASLDGVIYPIEDNRIEFEYAASGDLSGGSIDANAHRLEAFGSWNRKLVYNASLIHADPGFLGYFKDMNLTLLNVNYDFRDRYRFRGYFQATKRNLDLDPDRGTAPADRQILLEGRCINQTGWCAGGAYQWMSSRDRAPDPTHDWADHRLVFRTLRAGPPWTLDAHVTWGIRSDHLAGDKGFVQEYQAIARYQFMTSRDVAVSAYLFHNTLDDRPFREASRNMSLQVNWGFAETFAFHAQFLRAGGSFKSSQADIRLTYTWPRILTLGLRGTYSSVASSSTGKYGVLLEVSRDVAVPVARKTESGAVRGRVYDEETHGHPGIQGVVVRMAGSVAITDANGRFTLHAVSPGTHLLTVDPHTLGLDRILANGAEGIEVTVVAGKTVRVDIGVQRGATFTGTVRVYPSPDQANAAAPTLDDLYVLGDGHTETLESTGRPLASIVIRMTNEDGDVVERYTNDQGVFLFQGLKPGLWRVEVLDYNLPPHHYVQNPVLSLGLEAGKTIEVQFKVLPRKRKIRMLDSSNLALDLDTPVAAR